MNWKLVYLPEAAKDLKNLAGNQRLMVVKAIGKVLQNPLPVTEGGYGKPLGNKQGNRSEYARLIHSIQFVLQIKK